MRTAFTIGNEAAYDRALAGAEPPYKVGARPDIDPPYEGGWVWRTPGDAAGFVLCQGDALGFAAAVYEVELASGWDADVSPEPGDDGVHRLLVDARIIRKVWGTPRGARPTDCPA